MINDGLPLDLNDLPDVWGHPLHGKLRNGVLHLPNGDLVLDYPEPQAGTGYYDTYYVKRPGWAGPTRNAAQAAADAEAGYEWRDHATLTGLRFNLYGKPIDGWLWFDGDGNAWRYRVVSVLGPASATVFTIARQRFGRFGIGGSETQQVLAPVDLQQGGAYSWWDGPLQPMPAGIPPGSQYRVSSTSPSGSNAIYTISAPYDRPGYPSSWNYRAIAVCNISIASTGLASVSLLYGRDDCMGALAITGGDPWPTAGGGYVGYQNTESYRIVMRADMTLDVPPVWKTEEADRFALNPDWTYRPQDDRRYLAAPSSGAWGLDVTCIVGAWYDKLGALHTIRARAQLVYERTVSTFISTDDGARRADMGFSASATETTTLEISDNGTVFATDVFAATATHSASRWWIHGQPTGASSETMAVTVTHNGDVIGTFSGAKSLDSAEGAYGLNNFLCSSRLGNVLWGYIQTHAGINWNLFPLGSAYNYLAGCPAGASDVAAWSNHCVGVRWAITGPGTESYPESFVTSTTGAAVTPTGVVATNKTVSAPIADVLCRGSWCPSTGQFAGEHGNFTSGWTWV